MELQRWAVGLDSEVFGPSGFPPAEAGTPYPEDSLGVGVPVVCNVAVRVGRREENSRTARRDVSSAWKSVYWLSSTSTERPGTTVGVWGMESRLQSVWTFSDGPSGWIPRCSDRECFRRLKPVLRTPETSLPCAPRLRGHRVQ